MPDKITTKNALITSAEIFADDSHTTLTLMFDYGDGTQQAGPYILTDRLLRGILTAVGTRSWSKVVGTAVRVRTGSCPSPILPEGDIVLAVGNFLNDSLWCLL